MRRAIVFGTATDGFDSDNLTINSGGSVIVNSQTPQGTAVVEVDGDRLRIGERWIATTRLDDGHIVAWTEVDRSPGVTAPNDERNEG